MTNEEQDKNESDDTSASDQSQAFNTGLERGKDGAYSSESALDFSSKTEKESDAQERGYEAGKAAEANAEAADKNNDSDE